MKKYLILALLLLVGTARAQNLYVNQSDGSITSKAAHSLDLASASTQGLRFMVNDTVEATLDAAALTLATNNLVLTAGTLTLPATLDLAFPTNRTLAIQEAVAASACSGTVTATQNVEVLTATTCATTGSRIFITRTSVEAGGLQAYISHITDGVHFGLTSEVGDTGVLNWFIVHETP